MRKKRNTKSFKGLPFNPALKSRAKELRESGNLVEVIFWNQVKKHQLLGLDFDRQKIIGNYIVDFYCASISLVVEIDGSYHEFTTEYDYKRDMYLKSLGLIVIRIPAKEILYNLQNTMDWFHRYLKGLVD